MIISNISANSSAFGLKLGSVLQKDIDNSKNKLANHVNKDARKEFLNYYKTNVKYIEKAFPGKKLDLVETDEKTKTRKYIFSDENSLRVPIFVTGNDPFYNKLANQIKSMRHHFSELNGKK